MWSLPKKALKTKDEYRCRELLEKYNGLYDEYFKHRQESGKRNIPGSNSMVEEKKAGPEESDARCRRLLQEIDKTMNCGASEMVSDVLHNEVPQRYPINVLRAELQQELDRVMK